VAALLTLRGRVGRFDVGVATTISQVDIFMCIDKPNGPKMRDKKVGGVAPVWVREYTSRTMFLRMKQCYTDVLNDAKQRGV
jgi:hypothetical protein